MIPPNRKDAVNSTKIRSPFRIKEFIKISCSFCFSDLVFVNRFFVRKADVRICHQDRMGGIDVSPAGVSGAFKNS